MNECAITSKNGMAKLRALVGFWVLCRWLCDVVAVAEHPAAAAAAAAFDVLFLFAAAVPLFSVTC